MLALTILPLLAAATIAAFGCSSTPRPAAEGGQSPDAALTAYAWNPARAVGLGGELGKIELGYLADLVVLEDDPRRAVVQSLAGNPVRAVVIGGVVEKGGS